VPRVGGLGPYLVSETWERRNPIDAFPSAASRPAGRLACVWGLRLASSAHPPKGALPSASELAGHVIPNWVAVERPWRSGVYVREHVEDQQLGSVAFAGVNAGLRW
jgi:hypothetical protein